MADGDFRLIAADGTTIDLNELATSPTGVQAISGLTGFGLPSVEVQYQVNAGDGATYRSQRLDPRDIDLPVFIAGEDRAAMRSTLNNLTMALAGECVLQWDDGTTVWELRVRRVGGGEIVYGTDTDGTNFAQTTFSLRAGDPLWKSEDPLTKAQKGTITSGWSARMLGAENIGTAPTYPIVKVTGPTLGFTLYEGWVGKEGADTRDPSTIKRLTYSGFVPAGEVITVNMENGTVVNSTGANMYHNLAPNPRFFAIGPDLTNVSIAATVDTKSSAFQAALASSVTNFVTDPDILGTAWTFTGSSSLGSVSTAAYKNYAGKDESGSLLFSTNETVADVALLPEASIPVTGLKPGYQYDMLVQVDQIASDWKWGAAYVAQEDGYVRAAVPVGDSTALYQVLLTPGSYAGWRKITFTAGSNGSATITVRAPRAYNTTDAKAAQGAARIGKVAIVPSGTSYFDGSMPASTGATYSWSGAPNASTSLATSAGDPADVAVEVSIYMRNWVMV